MEREDWERPDTCSLCGAQIPADAPGVFAFGAGNALCGECAMARGGRYDAEREVWDRAPDLADLGDEAYGSSPHEQRR